jgi:hypothetical protein
MRVNIGANKPEQLLHLLTMLDLSYMIQDMTDNKDYTRRNRFNGQSVELTKEQADLHDQVFYHEALEQWDEMLKAKDKFSRLNPKAYMVLLD